MIQLVILLSQRSMQTMMWIVLIRILRFPCHSVNIPRMPPTNRFIIIEDLEDGFKKPCMLDIKLGTRMYCRNVE